MQQRVLVTLSMTMRASSKGVCEAESALQACRLPAEVMAHDNDSAETLRAFQDAVNMTPAKLERWLDSADSKRVGFKGSDGAESVGHHSGRRIVELLRKKKTELAAADFAHMKKVAGYVHRHLAQRPEGEIGETNWRYSLMNWGHDPAAAAH